MSAEEPHKGVSPLRWVMVVNKLLSLLEGAGTKVVVHADNAVILLQGKFPPQDGQLIVDWVLEKKRK